MHPAFWQQDGLLPRLLSPLSAITAGVTGAAVAPPGLVSARCR